MAQRFKKLMDDAITLLKDGKDPLQSNNEALKKFWQWKLWTDQTKHTRSAASNRETKGTDRVIVFPFAISGTEAHHYATVSKRAYEDSTYPGKDELNWLTGVAASTKIQNAKGFTPARANIRELSSTTIPVSGASNKITGRPYKTRSGSSQKGFSVPFGRSGTKTELDVQKEIAAAVAATGSGSTPATHRVSFRAEIYRTVNNVHGQT